VAAERLLREEIELAKRADRAEAVVLGCAGMSSLCDRLREATGVPVIDGVTAAIKLAEALIGAGYLTSKVSSYDYPRLKTSGCRVSA
jgi:allantoin racemase